MSDDSPSLSISPAEGKLSLSALQASTDLAFSLQGSALATAQVNCKVRNERAGYCGMMVGEGRAHRACMLGAAVPLLWGIAGR